MPEADVNADKLPKASRARSVALCQIGVGADDINTVILAAQRKGRRQNGVSLTFAGVHLDQRALRERDRTPDLLVEEGSPPRDRRAPVERP